MKTTSYKCDRCGAVLGENGESIIRTSFCTEDKIMHRIKLFNKWKTENPQPIVYELCYECRESLERWLNNENAG